MSQGLHALRVNSHTNRPNLNQSELVRKSKYIYFHVNDFSSRRGWGAFQGWHKHFNPDKKQCL